MRTHLIVTIAMAAGFGLGAVTVHGLHAQTKPPSYVVIDIAEMTNPEGFKAIPISAAASPARTAALGGRYLIRTETATAVDGIPPKRFVVLAFDSREKAQGWADATDIKEINAIRSKTTKSRAFIVDGFAN